MSNPTLVPLYPFDPTGTKATNTVPNESHIITAINWRDYHFIVPRWAPFFSDGIKLRFRSVDGTERYLIKGQDWYPSHEFISASRACAKPLHGSISMLNTFLAGVVTIESYQTIGGHWCQDEAKISQILADRLHNPRITSWEQLETTPYAFPVIDHEWDLVDMVGEKELLAALNNIELQLRLSGQQGLADHLANYLNPHRVNAAQVGLGLVNNWAAATVAEARAGLSPNTYMTPALVAEYVVNGIAQALAAHESNYLNGHRVTAAQTGAYDQAQTDALLLTKLGRYSIAVDSDKFGGQTPLDYKTWVLQGTAANTVKAYGLTLNELKLNIQNGSAADTERFAGYTFAEATAQILSGSAASADTFGGRTPAAYAASVLGGTAANSNLLGNQSLAQVLASAWGGTSAATATFGGKNAYDFTSSILASKIADSFKLEGKSLNEVVSTAQSGTSANTAKFGGKTPDEFLASITATGTAADSQRLSGKTLADVVALSQAGTSAATASFGGLSAFDFVNSVQAGKVADSYHLEGKTLAEVTALAQAGTSANTSKFGGLTPPEFMASITASTVSADSQKLAGKTLAEVVLLAQAGTATNSLQFGGQTPSAFTTSVLQGTAANSNALQGKTVNDIVALAVGGTAANSNLFGGKTPVAFTASVLSGKAADSYLLSGLTVNEIVSQAQAGTSAATATFGGKSAYDFSAAIINGTVANSTMFAGKDYAAVKADMLSGNIANAVKLGGLTSGEIVTLAQAGTSANSTLFGNLSVTDWDTRNSTTANSIVTNNARNTMLASQQAGTTTDAIGYYWLNLGTLEAAPNAGANPTDNSTMVDVQWLVTGGESKFGVDSGLYYLRGSGRHTGANRFAFQVMNLSGVNTGAAFGYTVNATGLSTVWMRVSENHSSITVNELAKGGGTLSKNPPMVVSEPAGIAYIVFDNTPLVTDAGLVAKLGNYVTNAAQTSLFESLIATMATKNALNDLNAGMNAAFDGLPNTYATKASLSALQTTVANGFGGLPSTYSTITSLNALQTSVTTGFAGLSATYATKTELSTLQAQVVASFDAMTTAFNALTAAIKA